MNEKIVVPVCAGLCVLILTLISAAGTASSRYSREAGTQETEVKEPLGCYLGGKVFEEYFPTAVELRETAFLTPFGTMNTNIVVGGSLSGQAAAGVLELAERMGEFLFSVNTSAMSDHIAILDKDTPEKYQRDKTLVLVGGPEDNILVSQLVKSGKSTVDWAEKDLGGIEVIHNAFEGPGTAIILAGNSDLGIYNSTTALASFFAHLAGATMIESWMLLADEQLQRGEVEAASRSFERIMSGLRIDGASNFHAPIKDWNEDFPKLLSAEAQMAADMLRFLRTKPELKEADRKFRKLARTCVYCHRRYLTYDRMAVNRVQFNYSQYPDHRLETEWDLVDVE